MLSSRAIAFLVEEEPMLLFSLYEAEINLLLPAAVLALALFLKELAKVESRTGISSNRTLASNLTDFLPPCIAEAFYNKRKCFGLLVFGQVYVCGSGE